MTADLTSWDPVLKDHYTNERIRDLATIESPLWMEVPKVTRGRGRQIIQPLRSGNPGGGGSDFTTANTNSKPSIFKEFQIPRITDYQVVKIDNHLMQSAVEDQDAFEQAISELDSGFTASVTELAWSLYRPSHGARGEIDSISSAEVTLTRKSDAMAFVPGMQITFAENASSGSLRDSGATLEVESVDLEGGTVTFTANVSTITGVVAGDFMYRESDRNSRASGILDWIPTDRSNLSTTFNNVNRSADPTRLAGVHRDYQGEPLAEALIRLVSSVGKYGGKPNRVYIHPDRWADLAISMESRKMVTEQVEVLGFSGIRTVIGPNRVTVLADPFCPDDVMLCLTLDTWRVWSAGMAPMFLRPGNRGSILRFLETEDRVQGRVGAYFNVGCSGPGRNGVQELA